MRTTPIASTASRLGPCHLAPAFVPTARTTALATSDHRHHALAPGVVRRIQDTGTSPATKRQSPPDKWEELWQTLIDQRPSSDEVVADGFMRMDLRQAKHETVQTCEGPYPQRVPLGEPTKPAAAQYQIIDHRRPKIQPLSGEDFRSQVLPPTSAYHLFCEEQRGKPPGDAWSAKDSRRMCAALRAAQPDNHGTGPVRKPRQHYRLLAAPYIGDHEALWPIGVQDFVPSAP